MGLKLIQKAELQLLQLSSVKSYLRITHDEEDELLKDLINSAIAWVEECTGKTIIQKTWQYTHTNNQCFLPNPPVQNITKVQVRNKVLKEGEYTVHVNHGRTRIEVPFSWKNKTVCVEYKAGYGETFQDIPPSLQQAILSTLAYLYENRSGSVITHPTINHTPWITYHRTYHMA